MKISVPKIELQKAIESFGGRSELASFLGITPEAVMNWQRKGRVYLPEKRAFQIAYTVPSLIEKEATSREGQVKKAKAKKTTAPPERL